MGHLARVCKSSKSTHAVSIDTDTPNHCNVITTPGASSDLYSTHGRTYASRISAPGIHQLGNPSHQSGGASVGECSRNTNCVSPNGLEHNIYQHISCDNDINDLPFLQ